MARIKNPLNTIYKICPTCKKNFTHEKRKPKTYCSKTCSCNSPEVKEKNRRGIAKTFEEKYGGHPMSVNDATKQNFKNSIQKKYGFDYFTQTKEFVALVKSTKLANHGDENFNNIEKMKTTCLNKYGVDNYRKTEAYKIKYIKTCIKKYGTPHASKSKEFKDSHKRMMFDKFINSYRFVNFVPKFNFDEYYGVTTKFNQKYPFECKRCGITEKHDISDGHDVKCTKCDNRMSSFQTEVFDYIRTILPNEPIITNNRSILSPLELDLYLPNKNVAIETNGVYWHSEVSGGKNKNYHLNKTKLCASKGIRLIHILDSEWHHKREIVKSILNTILTKNNKVIYARKCKVKPIQPKDKTLFLMDNHMQGNDHATVKLGLYFNNELISLMTFVKSRFDTKIEWEMSRFCSKQNTTIVGGSSKLFSHFIKEYKPNTIVSYSDRRYFSGETYLKLNFTFVNNTPPNYHYIIDNYDTLQSRINWQKSKLFKKLISFDPVLSEWENMKVNGFDRIWDCGHSKWIFISPKTE